MSSIYLTKEYLNLWKCKGFKPLEILDDSGKLLATGRIIYRFGIPYKTIIGGLGGEGIVLWNDETIKNILKNAKGIIEIYSFDKKPLLEKYSFKEKETFTFIVDIDNIEGLWKKIDKKNRNAIRFSEKSGIVFDEIKSEKELDNVYTLLKEQSKRWNFRIPEKDYIENVWNFMVKRGMAKFFITSYNNELLSVAQIFIHSDEISMPIWGNNEKAKKLKANNFLIWKILEWGNKHGYKKFNFWGTDPDPNSPLYGIHKFKESFGGQLVKVYRYEKSNFIYNVIKKLIR